jgi:hypothetical protein
MSATSIGIRIEGDDAQRQASPIGWTPDDESWVSGLADSGKQVRIRMSEDADTEGHALATSVAVIAADEDDTEGHAFTLHFPSVQDANDFRRKLLAAGVLTATIAVSAAGGAALGSATSGAGSHATAAISGQVTNQGQYNPANLGGTPLAPAEAAGQGQYNPANLGGTPLAPAEAAGQGQYNPANLGGTPMSDADEEQGSGS